MGRAHDSVTFDVNGVGFRKLFTIRAIRVIRGLNCFFQVKVLPPERLGGGSQREAVR